MRVLQSPSPPAREAWIEIPVVIVATPSLESPPAREAWIEIVWRMH